METTYTTGLDYADKTLLMFSGVSSAFSIASFPTSINTPVVVVSASDSLVFLVSNEILKNILKTIKKGTNGGTLFY